MYKISKIRKAQGGGGGKGFKKLPSQENVDAAKNETEHPDLLCMYFVWAFLSTGVFLMLL